MEKEEFEAQFDAIVGVALAGAGFQKVGRSLHARIGDAEIALVRLGGRMAHAGTIQHLLCVRKTWLRTRDERVPADFVREPFDHPFKLHPSKLERGGAIRYTPQNLNYDRDSVAFADWSAADVAPDLEQIRDVVLEVVVPWASSLSASALLKQLKKYGQKAWIERLWIEDCTARL